MHPERVDFTSADGARIAAVRWSPAHRGGPVRGVVQIAHGMGEHVLRYAPLAGALTARGFVVQGQDHRGHGRTAQIAGSVPGVLGPGGWDALVDDIGRLASSARTAHPGVPVVVLGHSMGSFAVTQFLLDHSREVDAAVLTGTAVLDALAAQIDPAAPIDLSGFNAAFAPARTDYDWLSRDPDQVDLYVADPWCGFGLDAAGTAGMLAGGIRAADPEQLARMRPDLPVYVAVGDRDPVGGPVVLARTLVERLGTAGLGDVTFRVRPGARHEVFNETDRDETVEDLLTWLDRVVPDPLATTRGTTTRG